LKIFSFSCFYKLKPEEDAETYVRLSKILFEYKINKLNISTLSINKNIIESEYWMHPNFFQMILSNQVEAKYIPQINLDSFLDIDYSQNIFIKKAVIKRLGPTIEILAEAKFYIQQLRINNTNILGFPEDLRISESLRNSLNTIEISLNTYSSNDKIPEFEHNFRNFTNTLAEICKIRVLAIFETSSYLFYFHNLPKNCS